MINSAIKVTQASEQDKRERTVKDIFAEFNEKLFCLAQQVKYHPFIKSFDNDKKQEAPMINTYMHSYRKQEGTEKLKLIQFFN